MYVTPVSTETLIGTKPTSFDTGEWQTSTLELTTTAEGDGTLPNWHRVEEVENPDPKIVTGVAPVTGPLVGARLTKCSGKSDADKHRVEALSKTAYNRTCNRGEIIRVVKAWMTRSLQVAKWPIVRIAVKYTRWSASREKTSQLNLCTVWPATTTTGFACGRNLYGMSMCKAGKTEAPSRRSH